MDTRQNIDRRPRNVKADHHRRIGQCRHVRRDRTLERGASVLMLEKADEALAGGNTKYTAGAMWFAYDSADDLLPLLKPR